MSKTKRAWIVDTRMNKFVRKSGVVFQYELVPTEASGFTDVHEARRVLYRARKALHTDKLRVITF